GAEAGSERLAVFAEERVDDAWDVVCALILTGKLRGAFSICDAAGVCGFEPGEEVVVVVLVVGFEAYFVVQVGPAGTHAEHFELVRVEGERFDDVVSYSCCCSSG